MSLSLKLHRYLKIRRSFGSDLSTSERVLKQFISFLETKNEAYIRSDLFFTMEASLWESITEYMGQAFGNGPVVCILVT